ncbi:MULTISPECIES: 3-isopropylmalate dehydratase large subunit [Dictyoglomus]|jgi:3-isopropylmalate/(R)-2-methylmalate dehydratase large subunit|uniref:3-isopropylmalate dehydratase large subunit n=1 Tax=Dictyoglomus turgidum (strain DSM 6724 / Z-1310) TaxID=515635 RepID=B8E2X0_DICTD|nr:MULTISPECIES: 3-isopropylmalate dehydratase large subunit [Dictyoglomus]ACK42470.1 3-isopropylmalate dehydratase, large subunit [Dictyoglomus turgidum DSM 6724]PNV80305.1 MAG: 3-isopropylmalate dehydratase large subunit [Dictyoglomus turgidum]HBU32074.1 3-isopropylmalate dehydratase large subunit [Dictyoglomus sp.]
MGMTITEKILADHSSKKEVFPGELIFVKLDFLLANDITGPLAIKEFEKIGVEKVFDNEKIALVPDHSTPNKDIKSAMQSKILREFAKKQGIKYYYEVGRVGIEHALLPEEGLVLPGDAIIGADSHTCTYGALGAFSTGVGSTDLAYAMATGEIWLKVPESIKFVYYGKLSQWVTGKDLILYTIGQIGVDGARYKAMEFTGEVIRNLSMSDRLTICNMAIEAGAKNGIIEPDEITLEYVRNRAKRNFKVYKSDEDAHYKEIYEWDVTNLEPIVAFPHLPSNIKKISDIGKDIYIDQVYIGSCTNGRIEDLRLAAKILKGHKVHKDVRLIVTPATPNVYMQALKEGLIEIFLEVGASITPPSCGPCLGGHLGVLAEGEKAVATTNRNFVGRMGHPKSEVYLSNPAVAAASAILGRIAAPWEVEVKE